MSRGGWSANAAAGLALFALLAVVLFGAGLAAINLPPLSYDPEQQSPATHGGDGREAEDTKAQIWMAWAAWVQAFISVLGFIGLGATVIFAALAWREARRGADAAVDAASAAIKANNDAREFFDIERRPWLTVEAFSPRVFISEEARRGHCTLHLRAKNLGNSPAVDVVFWVSKEVLHFWEDSDVQRLRGIIDEARAGETPSGAFLFAGEQRSTMANIGFEDTVPRDWPGDFFFVWGFVAYREREKPGRHFTPFCVNVLYSFDEKSDAWSASAVMQAVSIAPD